MKYLAFIFPVLLAFSAAPAYAATISLAPTTVSVTQGQSFTVSVVVNAEGTQAVTAQAELTYPSILQATAFTFAPTWIQISEPGYDSMGNDTIIKTGGYPGGFTGTETLGTVTFLATQTGVATINVSTASNVYNAQSSNILAAPYGSSQVAVAAAAPAPVSTAQTTVTTTTVTATTTTTLGSTTPTLSSTSSQAAAVAASGVTTGGFSVPAWVWIVIIILVLIALAWWLYPRKSVK